MADPRYRLLIVDDVADNRDILRRRFAAQGFEAVEADSGQSALDIIARGGIDLVLLDINMPDMDGVEVLFHIRETQPQSQLPVIMVTGSTQIADVMRARKFGANDYVMKPVDFNVALSRVRVHLTGKRRSAVVEV